MLHSRTHLLILAATGVILLLGTLAAAQDVKIHIGLGTSSLPPVVVTAPPQLIVVQHFDEMLKRLVPN